MRKLILLVTAFSMLVAGQAMAAKVDTKVDPFSTSRFYFGAGPNQNSLSNDLKSFYDDAQGFDLFVGYDLGLGFEQFKLMVEAGYFSSGEFEPKAFVAFPVGPFFDLEVKSTWAAAVVNFSPVRNLDLMLRAGYGRGSSDGSLDVKGRLGGIGVGYWFHKNIGARVTYTERDDIDSISVNATFRF